MRGHDITPANHDAVYDYFSEQQRTWPRFTKLVFGLSNAALNPVVRLDDPAAISHQHLQGKIAIIASNHPSAWDPFVASAALQQTGHPAFENPIGLAKMPLFTNPITRPLFEHTGCVPVMRKKDVAKSENDEVLSEATFDMLETIARMAIDQGRPIGITPEGTRSGHGEASTLTPDRIRDGISQLALLTSEQSYIVPVGIDYGDRSSVGSFSAARKARVAIGSPITHYGETVEEIRMQVYEAMSDAYDQAKEMRGHTPTVAWARRPR